MIQYFAPEIGLSVFVSFTTVSFSGPGGGLLGANFARLYWKSGQKDKALDQAKSSDCARGDQRRMQTFQATDVLDASGHSPVVLDVSIHLRHPMKLLNAFSPLILVSLTLSSCVVVPANEGPPINPNTIIARGRPVWWASEPSTDAVYYSSPEAHPAARPRLVYEQAPARGRSSSVQCSAITQKGYRCQRMTTSSNGRCWQHGGN